MKQNSMVKLLGIALVVAIVSTGIFYGLFVSKLSSNVGSGKTLVIAAKEIKAGSVLAPEDLKTIPWPAETLPKGASETTDQVAGKTVLDGLGEGEPILASRLASTAGTGGAGIPTGMRAVSVHVTDSTGVMGLLRAGQKVDVQVLVSKKASPADSQLRTAIEGLQVLSVIPQPEQSSQGRNLPVVTLLAGPSDADILALADSGASVRLTLRNPLDDATRTRGPLTLDTVMKSSGKAPSTSTKITAKSTSKRGAPGAGSQQ
jgi:pilus assembly protein CpaB